MRKLMKFVCLVGGVLGLVFGGIAGYVQSEGDGNETRIISAKSDTNGLVNSIDNPKVQSIEVMSNNES